MRRAVTLLACWVLVVGCGEASNPSAGRTPQSGSADAVGSPAIDAAAADYGVGSAAWPTTLDEARPVFAALPATVAGKHKDAAGGGGTLQAMYGSERAIFTVIAVPKDADAAVSLAEEASYQPCDKASRVGTAPLPGLPSASDDAEVWFACHLTGYSDMRAGAMDAQFLAWTSGGLVWWVEAPDRDTVAAMISPLAEAAGPAASGGSSTTSSAEPLAAGEAPYGIADVAWPDSLTSAAQLDYPTVAGAPARVRNVAGRMLFVSYPGVSSVLVGRQDRESGPSAMLSVLFGLVYTCAPGSFEGTALGIGGQPDRAPVSSSVTWFTCDVQGAEGDPHFRGHAAGWTSGDLAWLVVTSDESTTEDLVRAMADASDS